MASTSSAALTDPERVLGAIGRAVGADLAGTSSPVGGLIEHVDHQPWLLILEKLEQVAEVASDLAALLARHGRVAILATSRTAL